MHNLARRMLNATTFRNSLFARRPVIYGMLFLALALAHVFVAGLQMPNLPSRPNALEWSDAAEDFCPRVMWILAATSLWWMIIFTSVCCYDVISTHSVGLDWWPRSVAVTSATFTVIGATVFSIGGQACGMFAAWQWLEAMPTASNGLARYYHVLDGAIMMPMTLIAFAFGACVPARSEVGLLEQRTQELRSRIASARGLLLVASGLMIVGVLEVLVVFLWMAEIARLQSASIVFARPADVTALGTSLAVGLGIGFSFYLAVAYVLLLQDQFKYSRKLAWDVLPHDSHAARQQWLHDMGIVQRFWPKSASLWLPLIGPAVAGLTGGSILEWAKVLIGFKS